MQNKDNQSNQRKKQIIILLKTVLFITGLVFVIAKLSHSPIDILNFKPSRNLSYVLAIALLLMILNWCLEAIRWKVSVSIFEPISLRKAGVVVLSGLALNWILPFTTGDILSRISQSESKYKATAALVLNRGIMLGFTLILGVYGLSEFADNYEVNGWFGLIILFGIPLIRKLFKKKINSFLDYFKNLERSVLLQIISISFVRYLVFTIQFYLLLNVFMPEVPDHLLIAGIGWIFLSRSILPLFLGGMGVREAAGILFFEPYVEVQMIVIPAFLIWFINIVIPSFVGLFLVWKLKNKII